MKRCVLLCTLTLLACIAFAQEKKPLTFDQVYKNGEPRLLRQLPSITGWVDDSRYLESKRKEGDERPRTYAVDLNTGAETPYGDMSQYKEVVGEGIDPASATVSDAKRSLYLYQKEKDLYLLLGTTRTFKRLTESPDAEEKNPTLSPDGGSVAFTRNNDLYSIDLATGRETRYTNDGTDLILNGWASWLYYEEILGRPSRYRAFWWSPDGKRIAFYRFDDAQVPEFLLYNSEGQHGFVERTRYPKVGDPNPEVRIGIAATGTTRPAVWAAFDPKADQYFGMPFWTPDGKELLVDEPGAGYSHHLWR
jgi:dipeptidyl-peptidase-4